MIRRGGGHFCGFEVEATPTVSQQHLDTRNTHTQTQPQQQKKRSNIRLKIQHVNEQDKMQIWMGGGWR
jgi:alkaline phosphatase